MHFNFLESVGIFAIVGLCVYFLVRRDERRSAENKFFDWILKVDSKAHEEFQEKYGNWYAPSSKYYKCLREFFTEEKLKEINDRWEGREDELEAIVKRRFGRLYK